MSGFPPWTPREGRDWFSLGLLGGHPAAAMGGWGSMAEVRGEPVLFDGGLECHTKQPGFFIYRQQSLI